MARADDTLAARLRAAMLQAGCVYQGQPSARALAKRLAGPNASDKDVDAWRKQVRRWLDKNRPQQTIRRDTAVLLSNVLGVSADYWPTEREQPGNSLNSRLEAAEAALTSVTRPLTEEERATAERVRDEIEAMLRTLREAAGK